MFKPKHTLWVLTGSDSGEAFLMSTHYICFDGEIRKKKQYLLVRKRCLIWSYEYVVASKCCMVNLVAVWQPPPKRYPYAPLSCFFFFFFCFFFFFQNSGNIRYTSQRIFSILPWSHKVPVYPVLHVQKKPFPDLTQWPKTQGLDWHGSKA